MGFTHSTQLKPQKIPGTQLLAMAGTNCRSSLRCAIWSLHATKRFSSLHIIRWHVSESYKVEIMSPVTISTTSNYSGMNLDIENNPLSWTYCKTATNNPDYSPSHSVIAAPNLPHTTTSFFGFNAIFVCSLLFSLNMDYILTNKKIENVDSVKWEIRLHE